MSAFSEQLWNLPADLSASLLHGSVCGLLCAAPGESSLSYRRADTLQAGAAVERTLHGSAHWLIR